MSFTPPEVSKDTASSTAAGTGQNTPTGAASTRSDAKEPARFGITHPITTQEATEAEVLASEMLKQELEIDFPRETAQGLAKREEVLQELQRIISEWISEEGRAQGVEASMSAKIVTVGSYRLGVVQPGSDIDTLCIAPPHVTREAFFTVFLKKLEQNPHVSDCVPIPGAYTPIIKLKLRGVSIDLLFARLVRSLDDGKDLEEAVKDDEVLRDMDDKSVRCINGYRVADRILQLVPNQDAFRETLRFVKCWAKRRGIYSNVLGFFGGITWALLVARVCQLYPNYCFSQLVNRFFRTYDQWNWSKPVVLCEIVESVAGIVGQKPWNPKTSLADKQHLMPVITPAFPAMNSTHNVTDTTKRILLDEFRRGYEVVKKVENNKADWKEVHNPFPFFSNDPFKHYLCLEVLAKSAEAHVKFCGWVESKLRILHKTLEGAVSGMMIHPNPEQYELRSADTEWEWGCGMFIELAFLGDQGSYVGQTVDLRPSLHQFAEVVSTWAEKETYNSEFKLKLKTVKRTRLPEYALKAEAAKRSRQHKG
mmetsp:Transcript_68012/g.162347  ORF Transcript_68012/g.162347 Transcript_68012/m.162347 type:complete len:536 (-) Transcript_68012:118-1725(-)